MPVRRPIVAGAFYPQEATLCRQQVKACLAQAPLVAVAGTVLGGMVPHAGWVYSGPTAGTWFQALAAGPAPETFVLFGAVHSWGVDAPSLYTQGVWRTPLGDVAVDEEVAHALLAQPEALVVDRPAAHAQEHSLEVQLPFVQHLFPQARILPIAVPPLDLAPAVGRQVAQAVRAAGRRAVALGSSDMTHYGPRYGMAPAGVGLPALEWTHANDRRLLDLAVRLRAEEIVPEARVRHNACGAGAVAAAIAFAVALGATQGALLHYTTSYEVLPEGRPSDLVGYGAVAFCAP